MKTNNSTPYQFYDADITYVNNFIKDWAKSNHAIVRVDTFFLLKPVSGEKVQEVLNRAVDKLQQKGSHEALLSEKQGKYFELWEAQAQYYTSA